VQHVCTLLHSPECLAWLIKQSKAAQTATAEGKNRKN